MRRFRLRRSRRAAELARLLVALDAMAAERRPWQQRRAAARVAFSRWA